MKIETYDKMVTSLRTFFRLKGYIEVGVQHNLSILAACEDPTTVSTFEFDGTVWPLPQTGQMHLEHILLRNPTLTGVYCITTSYRNEPNPVPGRHDLIFPMFEFEGKGNMKALIELEKELLGFMGLWKIKNDCNQITYEDACTKYGVDYLGFDEEEKMCENGGYCFLTDFPHRSQPFWNMKQTGKTFNKVDVILNGVETIGSAERETDIDNMKDGFYNVSDGQYANMLFNLFGKERVLKELTEYFKLPMFSRFGGGIGLTRLAKVVERQI